MTPGSLRSAGLMLGVALVAAACSSTAVRATDGTDPARAADLRNAPLVSGVEVDQIASTPREDVPSALSDPINAAYPSPIIDPGLLVAGGPPPDGIPPIDEPRFLTVQEVNFLADEEPVLALEVEGETRAYPAQIMTWHEIVNDTIGGVPVAVTYCPLCNSAIAYDRRLGDRILDFGTSGALYQSALVMYDRQTESLWTHFTGEGAVGILAGAQLELIPMATVAWSDWKTANPDGLVLSRDTGHTRSYGSNPYVGYDNPDEGPFAAFFQGDVDARLRPKERVVGLRSGDAAAVIATADLSEVGVAVIELGGREVTVWFKAGTSSALDASGIADGVDVGSSAAWLPIAADGTELTFSAGSDGEFVDDQTSSTWNILGEAVSGPLAGEQLEGVEHLDTFWFAWATYQPDAELIEL